MAAFDRETVVFVAKSLVKAERYEDAIDAMKCLFQMNNVRLSDEEKHLIIQAYRTVIDSRRASWISLVSIGLENPSEKIKEYAEKVEKEQNGFAGELATFIFDAIGVDPAIISRTSAEEIHPIFNTMHRSAMVSYRETTVFVAESLVKAKRYQDAIDMMKPVDVQLSKREIVNFLIKAYKTVIASRRASWRILVSIDQENPTEKIKEYAEKVGKEINGFVCEMASIVNDRFLPSCNSSEDYVLYQTMVGDCHGYSAELTDGVHRQKLTEEAVKAYSKGTEIAKRNHLHVADATRLELVLNSSVFYYEILDSVETARGMAQGACDAATPELGTLNAQARMEREKILTLLSANLAKWANANV